MIQDGPWNTGDSRDVIYLKQLFGILIILIIKNYKPIFLNENSDVVANFIGEAAICFSRNGKFYYAHRDGEEGDQPAKISIFIIE